MNRIFVVGAPRSGTTLVQALVASHPALVTFPETHFFRALRPSSRLARWLRLASRAVEAELEGLAASLDVERSGSGMPIRTARSATGEFTSLLDEHARVHGAQGWVEKTPAHLHWIETIRTYVPDARFCHVLRRGPDVVASLREVTRKNPEVWGGPRSLDRCMQRWIDDVEMSLQHVGRSGHVHVRYDEVTRDPEKEIRQVWKALGLPEVALDSGEFSDTRRSAEPDEAPWQRVGDSVDRDRSGTFTEALNPEQQERVLRRLREVGERRGLRFHDRPLYE